MTSGATFAGFGSRVKRCRGDDTVGEGPAPVNDGQDNRRGGGPAAASQAGSRRAHGPCGDGGCRPRAPRALDDTNPRYLSGPDKGSFVPRMPALSSMALAPSSTTTSAPPSPSPTPVDPARTGPSEGSDCAHLSDRRHDDIEFRHTDTLYQWTRRIHLATDTGVKQVDPAIAGQIGWENCLKQFPQAKCVAAAAAIAGSQNLSGPVFPDGTYDIPDSMPFGTCSAIPGPKGSCAFYIYDSTGKLVDSGSYTNALDKPIAEVDPVASNGRFQTVGCTPWVMIKPALT